MSDLTAAKTLLDQARALDIRGRHDEALAIYNKLLARFGEDRNPQLRSIVTQARTFRAGTYSLIAQSKLLVGKFGEASDAYRKAIRQTKSLRKNAKEAIERYILKYFGLAPKIEKNQSNGNDLPKHVITEETLREYISEDAEFAVEKLSQPEDLPFPILPDSEIEAIIAHGKTYSWDTRTDRGWHYHTNAFKYVWLTYRPWVNRGLTREILAQADSSLAVHLNKKISREGLPEWLDLPTGAEARARAITDPAQRAELEVTRKVLRERTRKHRASLGD